jgi:uncharacterized membrane protein
MYTEGWLLGLRVVHVVAGVMWVGGSIFLAAFLFPSVRAAGPAGGPVMRQLAEVRRLPLFMLTASVLGITSGLALYWRDTGGLQHHIVMSGPGLGFGVGGCLAVGAALIGSMVASPTARRMGALGAALAAAQEPPAAEQICRMQGLERRLSRASLAASSMLVMATVAMAVARYLP